MIINKVKPTKDGLKLTEIARYDGENITGGIQINDISREDVINQFNNGYYVVTEE